MEYVYFALAGLAGGLLGGMGMGGGTVLIPLLSIFMNVDQHAAQALNLISFLPMAVVALVIVPALLFAVLGCFAAKNTEGELLGKLFGGFLAALSVFQFCSVFRKEE